MTTYTPAVIKTGVDSKGNLFSFWKNYENMWVDGYNECVVTADFIRAHVYPKVQKIYFSDFVMTGEDWVEAGCPLWLTSEQIELLKTGDGSVVEMAMVTEKSIDAILDVPVVENTKHPLYAKEYNNVIEFDRFGKSRFYKKTARRIRMVNAASILRLGSGGLRVSRDWATR